MRLFYLISKANKRASFTFLFPLLAILNCQNNEDKNLKRSYSYTFTSDDLEFTLDSISIASSNTYQVFEDENGSEFLATLNGVDHSIKIYPLDSVSPIDHTIKLSVDQSPNSIKGNPYFFQILNKDSILILAEFTEGLVSLVNFKGQLIDSYTLPIFENLQTNYHPGFNSSAPVQYLNGKFIFPYSISKIKNSGFPPLFSFDPETDSIIYRLKDIKLYTNLNLNRIGDKEFFKSSMTFNTKEKFFIMSFPLDKNLYKVDTDLNLISTFDGSSIYERDFIELGKNVDKYRSDERKFLYHRYGNSRYTSIVYDKWKDLYYRINFHGYTDDQIDKIVEEGIIIYPQFSIHVFDNKFKTLFEYQVNNSDSLSYHEFFVSKKGLALKKENVLDENRFKFKIFNVSEK